MAGQWVIGEAVPALNVIPHESTPAARLVWIDTLKGVGILLVVVGHTMAGLIDGGYDLQGTWMPTAFAAIYVFHMPLFIFLTGLFVAQRLEADPDRFRRQLFSRIAWPYFLWGGIQILAVKIAGDLVNHPSGPLANSFLRIFYAPPSQFWFLYALFFLHGLSLVMGRRTASPMYFVLLLAAGSLVEVNRAPEIWQAVYQMAPYYGLGVLAGPILLARDDLARAALWSVPVGIIALAMAVVQGRDAGIPGVWPMEGSAIIMDVRGLEYFYAVVAILAAMICLAQLIGPAAPRWLTYCGRRTMPIFVMHILFIASTRILIQKTGIAMPVFLLLPVLCVAGIVFPLLAAAAADRLRISRWLGFV